MSQKPISPPTGQPFQVQNYYFQIIMLNLINKKLKINQPTQSNVFASSYQFTVVKGNQKYQKTNPIQPQKGNCQFSLGRSKINFVAINYNPNKTLTFDLRMIQKQTLLNKQVVSKQIGEFILDANTYIDNFIQSQNGAFLLRVDFDEQWTAQIELYVEKSRYGVQRLVKQQKQAVKDPILHQQIQQNIIKKPNNKEQELQLKQQIKIKKEHKDESYQKQQKKAQKKPKEAFIPKKQWIIPQAQKYLARAKNNSRASNIKNDSSTEQKQSSIKQQKKILVKQMPKEQDYSFSAKMKISIIAILALLFFFVSLPFLKDDASEVKGIKVPQQKITKKQKVKKQKVKNKKQKNKK